MVILTEVSSVERTVLFVRDRILFAYPPSGSFAIAVEQVDAAAFSPERIAAARAGGAERSGGIGKAVARIEFVF